VVDLIDGFSSNVLLPTAGLGISLFAGWVLPCRALAEELGLGPKPARGLALLLRYVVPAFIVLAALDPAIRAL
jgi:SNF family Na+-dependent transporter